MKMKASVINLFSGLSQVHYKYKFLLITRLSLLTLNPRPYYLEKLNSIYHDKTLVLLFRNYIKMFFVNDLTFTTGIIFSNPEMFEIRINFLTRYYHFSSFECIQVTVTAKPNLNKNHIYLLLSLYQHGYIKKSCHILLH